MKWTTAQLQTALKKSAEDLPSLVLVYGEDSGMVRMYSRELCAKVSPDMDDPFLVTRVSIEELSQNPSILRDSAGTISFGSGQRLVRLEGVNSDVNVQTMAHVKTAIEIALADPQSGSVIVVGAAGIPATHALVRLVEKSADAAGVRCYHDNARGVEALIQSELAKFGLKVKSDALAFLKDNLGNDREISLRELEKLAIYAVGEGYVTLDHCLDCISSAPSINIFKLCDMVGMGQSAQVDRLLGLLTEEGADAHMIFAVVLRHLRRLLQAKEYVETGEAPVAAMKRLSPPVAPFAQREFEAQMRAQSTPRLRRVLERFNELQKQSRQTGYPSDLILLRGVLSQALS